ncbi:MAG: MarC family protein [Paracoccaceae bacterium]
MIDTAFLVTAFTALFVVIDPVGLTPLFVTLTQGAEPGQRRAIGLRACLIAFALLTAFAIFGEAVLGFVGITMPAFRIAGGALLFLTALDMLFERRAPRRQGQVDDSQTDDATPEDESHDPSVFPLALPLIAGPGAIATVILLAGQRGDTLGLVAVIGTVAAVLAVVFAFFLASGLLERALGKTGINIATRLLGMLLAALSVQFILDGLKAFGFAAGIAPGIAPGA